MSKEIKSFEEFELRFKNQYLPESHYTSNIANKVLKTKKTNLLLRTSFITICLTLFITASLAVAMQITGWKFFDSDGKQVFEMKTMSEEEAKPHLQYDIIMAKHNVAVNEIKKKLSEGEFTYFLSVEGYEKIGATALAMIMNGNKIDSVTQIPTDFIKAHYLKDAVQKKYELTEGTIWYYPNHDKDTIISLAEEMYLEAKKNKTSYIEKGGLLSAEISSVELNYKSESRENHQGVKIRLTPINNEMHTTEELAANLRITEDGVDYLFNKESQRVYFVKEYNSRKILVSIFLSFKGVEEDLADPEELISIAKSLVN